MSRHDHRVPFHLDSGNVKSLPPEDIAAILRAAHDIVGSGGRSLLTKILRGSRQADVVKYEHDLNPSYGYFCALSEADVLARIDWTIRQRYLRIVYQGKLPVLELTFGGWEIEVGTLGDEILARFDSLLADSAAPYALDFLKGIHRDVATYVLLGIRLTHRYHYLPILTAWRRTSRRLRDDIQSVIDSFSEPDTLPHSAAPDSSGPLSQMGIK